MAGLLVSLLGSSTFVVLLTVHSRTPSRGGTLNPAGDANLKDDQDDEDYPYMASSSGYLYDDLWDDDLHDLHDDEDDNSPYPHNGTGDARDPPAQAA